ncbi:DUF3592 domain-containing protein [Candidatus Sumerlaeota bacterium]|nr:DUF3592 domain-containing protein [Candidatus Sumerlaeota bacterium]
MMRIQHQSSGCLGFVILIFMGVLFSAIGGGLIIFVGLPTVHKAKASLEWPTTDGVVTSSEVVTSHDEDGTTYGANIIYRYTIDGQELIGDTVWYGGNFKSSSKKLALKTVGKYPKDKQVTVHYDPDRPNEAVLEPGAFKSTYFMLIFGGVFLVVGLLMLAGSLFKIILGGALLGMLAGRN